MSLAQRHKSGNFHASLIERFGGKAYFVVPIDGERVEGVVAKIIHVLKLAADAFLHQRGKVHKLHHSIVESKLQDVVAHIVGCCDSQKKKAFPYSVISRGQF